jgi:CelD/BcsL family acetyltransferase involved in cellulose biosynthesis
MNAELITDLGALAAIEDEWRSLAVPRGNAFLTPEWYRAWVAPGAEQQPMVVAVRRDDALLGVLPLVLDRSGRPHALRFGGASFGDRFGVAAKPGAEDEVAAAAMGALEPTLPSAPILVLNRVDAEGSWVEAMRAASQRRLVAIEQNRAELPHVESGGLDWESYLAQRSRHFRQRVGRGLERALDRDGVRYSVRVTSERSALEADMETLFHLHDLRHPGSESSIARPEVREALTRFAGSALDRGWLRLRLLEIDGSPAAAALGWRIAGSYSLYTGGFDPAFAERSAGLLMLNLTVRSAIEEEAEDIDLLLGGEPYKWRFAPEARHVRTVVLVGATSPTRMVVAGEALGRRLGRGMVRWPVVGPIARRLARGLPSDRAA